MLAYSYARRQKGPSLLPEHPGGGDTTPTNKHQVCTGTWATDWAPEIPTQAGSSLGCRRPSSVEKARHTSQPEAKRRWGEAGGKFAREVASHESSMLDY